MTPESKSGHFGFWTVSLRQKTRICGRQRCLTQWPARLVPAARWRPSPQQALCVGVAGSRVYDAKMQRLWSQTRNALWRNGTDADAPHRHHGLHVPEQINAKLPLLVEGLPAHCCRWRYCAAAGRSPSIAPTITQPGVHPAIAVARFIRYSASMTQPLISFSPPRLPSLVGCMTPSPLSFRMTGAA